MKNDVMVSVCMITYNHEKYIRQAIEGVLTQKTDFPIELVIGEDCSRDATREICLEYQRKYPSQIRLLLPEHNLGMHNNFLNTLNACTGKYIAFCEGDDYWIDPLKLQKQVDFMEINEGFVMCFHACKVVQEEDALPDTYTYPSCDVLKMKSLLWHHYIPTASLMVRETAVPVPYPEWTEKLAMGDMSLELLVAEKGLTKFFKERMSVYRRNSTSITHSAAHRKKAFKSYCMLYYYLNREFRYKYWNLFLFKLLWFIGGHIKASLYRLLGLIK